MKADHKESPVITLCALTYHRPDGVRKLLEGLGNLRFSEPAPALNIVIVDNDPDGSGRPAVIDAAQQIHWPVRYCIEPQRGITYARNRALDEAADSDWIGFLDDDEIPHPDWLAELLRVQCAFNADVVSGPALPAFLPGTSRWIEEGGFFNPMRYETGTVLPYCFTNNVLFRTQILRETGLRFDHRFALTGGEDRDFFKRVERAGYRIVWADNAQVFETIPQSRAVTGWILRRSYRCGITISATDLASMSGLKTRARLFLRAGWCAAKGGVLLLLTWPLGRQHLIRHLQGVCWGGGMFAALFGVSYTEYKTTHGS